MGALTIHAMVARRNGNRVGGSAAFILPAWEGKAEGV